MWLACAAIRSIAAEPTHMGATQLEEISMNWLVEPQVTDSSDDSGYNDMCFLSLLIPLGSFLVGLCEGSNALCPKFRIYDAD